jgi:hypothetical protein
MPVNLGKDTKGKFYRYGTTGAKYYFTGPITQKRAYELAARQGRAIQASKARRFIR